MRPLPSRSRTFLSLIAGSFLITGAFAQNSTFRPELFELSPFGGGRTYLDIDSANEPHFTNGAVFGGRVTENPWQHLGFEQSVGYNRNQFRFDNPVPGVVVMNTPLNTRVLNANFDVLGYFTRRGSRVRPFVAAGIGGVRFSPTDDAITFFQNNSIKPTNQLLRQETRGQYNYGGGVKIRLNNWLGVRFDVRDYFSWNPTFGMSTVPNGQAYIANGDRLNALEATAGLVIIPGHGGGTSGGKVEHLLMVGTPTSDTPGALVGVPGAVATNLAGLTADNSTCAGSPVRITAMATDTLGHDVVYHWTVNAQPASGANTLIYTPMMPGLYRVELQITDSFAKKPAAPVYAAPVTIFARDCTQQHSLTVNPIQSDPASALVGGGNLNPANSVCSATPVNLSATATDPLGHALAYRWTVNGQQVGGNTNTLAYTPPQPGQYRVELQVSDTDANPAPPVTVQAVIYARDCARPTITCSAAPASVTLGQTVPLRVTATVAAGNTALIAWSAPEGTFTNANGAQTTFNSTGVAFPAGGQVQTKTVTATATVTDDSRQTASCNTPIRVTSVPPSQHYGDILFGGISARVNNAAKRVLIERVYPLMTASPGYTLVLVGHYDASENGAARELDRKRVLNTAAVLSANRDACKDLELSRMRADWVGLTNTEYKEAVSTGPVLEREADRVNTNDPRSKNRRVEIWLVPPGQPMPASVKTMRPLPAAEVQRLGCPK